MSRNEVRPASFRFDSSQKDVMKCRHCSGVYFKKDAMLVADCYHYICWNCFVRSDRKHCPFCGAFAQMYRRCYDDSVFSCRIENCFDSFSSQFRREDHERTADHNDAVQSTGFPHAFASAATSSSTSYGAAPSGTLRNARYLPY